MKSVEGALPLTEVFYYILLTLYAVPCHGYAIMQEVEKMTHGRLLIGAGTLYTALNTLLKKGWITLDETPSHVDARRKIYAITEDGQRVLVAETDRLAELVDNGRLIISRSRRLENDH